MINLVAISCQHVSIHLSSLQIRAGMKRILKKKSYLNFLGKPKFRIFFTFSRKQKQIFVNFFCWKYETDIFHPIALLQITDSLWQKQVVIDQHQKDVIKKQACKKCPSAHTQYMRTCALVLTSYMYKEAKSWTEGLDRNYFLEWQKFIGSSFQISCNK